MTRWLGLHAEIFAGLDDTVAEKAFPLTIDPDAGGEGILWRNDPLRERQAIARGVCGQWRQRGGCVGENFITFFRVLAAMENVGGAWFW